MHKRKPLIAISTLLLAVLACNTLVSPPSNSVVPLTEADVPRVAVEDAKAAFDEGTAIIVDVRSRQAYDLGHVTGALSIPLDEFEADIAGVDLPKDQWIITYCT